MFSANADERALKAGTAVGPYEIVSFLAAGGMGEVYVARDERLGREVAIKVLPAIYGSDPERLKRFEQEARATGVLNHPNVIAVYDVGKEGPLPYIVTELLEGRTLRKVLQESSLPLRQALDYAIQIARGVAAAHDKGIIHRDLKPANIFITAGGHVKIVDFGLAKLAHPEWERTAKDEDTVSMASRPGSVVGSAGYMSPEQVAGTAADHRSDIFSFGAILYEMVTGRRAFHGESVVEGMHAILKEEPLEIETKLPSGLHLIIQRCLKKNPAERFQSARDLVFSLEELPAARATAHPWSAGLRLPRRRFVTAMAVALTLAVVGGFVARQSGASRPKPSVEPDAWPFRQHEIVPLPELGSDMFGSALSPDGNLLAYAVWRRGKFSLLVRQLVSGRELVLAPPRDIFSLRTLGFSRDGNYLYYHEKKDQDDPARLLKVSIFGGEPFGFPDEIRPAEAVTFSPDETRVFFESRDEKGELCQMIANVDGSALRILTCVPGLKGATWAPHGRSIVAIVKDSSSPWSLIEIDVSTAESRRFCRRGKNVVTSLEWLPDGTGLIIGTAPPNAQLLYVSYPGDEIHPIFTSVSESFLSSATADSRTLFAVRSNVETSLWKVSLNDDRRTEQSRSESLNGWNGLAWLPTGEILMTAEDASGAHLWISDSEGLNRREFLERPGGKVKGLAASNRFVVFVRQNASGFWAMGDLWRADLDGKNLEQLTSGVAAGRPSFTPDGEWIVYTVMSGTVDDRGTPAEARAWKVHVNGGEPQIIDPDRQCMTAGVSPNGKWLACFERETLGMLKTVIPIEGGPPVWQRDFPSVRRFLRWMPDSSGIAYALWDLGDTTIRVQPLNDGPSRLLTTLSFESQRVTNFAFSPDGKELFVAASRGTNQPFLIRDKTVRKR